MVSISKEEKGALCARFPRLYVVRTMKQKSGRHRYYTEESPEVLRVLGELRGQAPADKGGRTCG